MVNILEELLDVSDENKNFRNNTFTVAHMHNFDQDEKPIFETTVLNDAPLSALNLAMPAFPNAGARTKVL